MESGRILDGEKEVLRGLSGVQPSGDLHIGNYYGAIRQFVESQDRGDDLFVFIADWHALTTQRDAEQLRDNIRKVIASYIALGVDPEKTTIYQQSQVKGIQEISWILSCLAPYSRLTNATSFKEKAEAGLETSIGLLTYPVLMAADILAVNADFVPVGDDQRQHLEITRELARKFNHHYGDTFVVPEGVTPTDVARLPGTDGRKMSKSYGNTISIFNTKKGRKREVNSIVTDSRSMGDILDPESCNVFAIYNVVAEPEAVEELRSEYQTGSVGYGHAKQRLISALDDQFGEANEKYNDLMNNPEDLNELIEIGNGRANVVVEEVLESVREKVGLNI